MANYCEICGKHTATGFNVSHSHLKTKRTWKPNIQRVRVKADGQVKRMNVCFVLIKLTEISDKVTGQSHRLLLFYNDIIQVLLIEKISLHAQERYLFLIYLYGL